MKGFKRIIVASLIFILIISSMTVFSSAASSTGDVYLNVKQNYAEAQKILTAINKERSKKGLAALKMDSELCDLAVKRAAESIVYIDYDHTRPDGTKRKTLSSRIDRENWCIGYANAAECMKAWMGSSSHNNNILNTKAKSVGIAFVTNEISKPTAMVVFSFTKQKKAMKTTTGTKVINVKVTAKNSYLKRSDFELEFYGSTHWPIEMDWNGVYEGDSFRASADLITQGIGYYNAHLNPNNFTWKSSNKLVATVTNTGVVKAHNHGDVTITATMKAAPNYSLTKKIHIEEKETEYDPDYDHEMDPYYEDYFEYFGYPDPEEAMDCGDDHARVDITEIKGAIFRSGHTEHQYCTDCFTVLKQGTEIPAIDGYSLTVSDTKYNGKPKTPKITFTAGGKVLQQGKDYTVKVTNNTNAGMAMVYYTFIGDYDDTFEDFFYISKAANTLTASAKAVKVKYKKLKKKNQTVTAAKAFTVSKNIGAVTYRKVSGNSKITVASNGKITVKKKLKKGTYKVTVAVTAAGNANYAASTKNVVVAIKVK